MFKLLFAKYLELAFTTALSQAFLGADHPFNKLRNNKRGLRIRDLR